MARAFRVADERNYKLAITNHKWQIPLEPDALPFLLYCVTGTGAATIAGGGVRGAPVEHADSAGLSCFYSPLNDLTGDAETIKLDALDVHRVVRRLFLQADIVPFRFPTTLPSLAEIGAYLEKHAGAYHAALSAIRGNVQMELRVGVTSAAEQDESSSGAEYLKSRARRARQLDNAVARLRAAINEEVIDWRQHESARGVRCFVLVRREAVVRIQEKIKQVRLEEAANAALSGPWPPTEFLPAVHD